MVFYTITLVMRPRNRLITATSIKEICHSIYDAGGCIRKLSNEGILRPYRKFRDERGDLHAAVRYWTLQIDMSESDHRRLGKTFGDHPDVLRHLTVMTERSQHLAAFAQKQDNNGADREGRDLNLGTKSDPMVLDAFVRYEEEINWPPQVSAQALEHMDMNWKQFQKNRWSAFLRS